MASATNIKLSAVSESINEARAKTETEALPREIIHNLRYQHGWSDLQLHTLVPQIGTTNGRVPTASMPRSSPADHGQYIISGMPPRHSYIHPDFLNHMIKHNLEENDVAIQREWVLPTSTGQRWSLAKFCHIFDNLPTRDAIEGASGFHHQDAKRILCAMKANDGSGGDGTIVYYIMQEGEVKPRQN